MRKRVFSAGYVVITANGAKTFYGTFVFDWEGDEHPSMTAIKNGIKTQMQLSDRDQLTVIATSSYTEQEYKQFKQ